MACGAIVFAASCTSFSSTACRGMLAMSDQAHSFHNATMFNVAPFLRISCCQRCTAVNMHRARLVHGTLSLAEVWYRLRRELVL